MTRTNPGILSYTNEYGDDVQVELREEATTLGRGGSCSVVLPLPTVSRLHALIELHDGRYILSDAGSTNGTFINGERIEQGHQLRSGDRIGLGPTAIALLFSDPDETMAFALGSEAPALFIDEEGRTVQLYGGEVPLGPLEYGLLLYLASDPGAVCTREACFQEVWGQPYDPTTCEDALNACIARLRRNLRATAEEMGGEPPAITTIPRVGFRLDADVAFRLRGVYPRKIRERTVGA